LMASSHRHRLEPELSRLSAPATGVSKPAGLASTAPSAPAPNRSISSTRVSIASLLYLSSVGLVGAATVGLFFGSGFLMLGQPSAQMHAEFGVHDRDTEVAPLRLSGLSENTEDTAPFSGGVQNLSSTASGAAINASVQTTAPDEPTRSSMGPSAPEFRGQGSTNPRKLSRLSHSRSGTMPGQTRARSAQSAKQDRARDPEEYTADGANQQEYNQLHATGSAVSFAAEAPSR
jgi:hypothetical protein